MQKLVQRALCLVAAVLLMAAAACTARSSGRDAGQGAQGTALQPVKLAGGQKLRVVATSAILGDVVKNIGGDAIDLTVLIGPGQDPHAYEPNPRDVGMIEKAHVVFINGLGLEAGLESTIRAATSQRQPVITASEGAKLLTDSPDMTPAASQGAGAGANPHVWFDPSNVKVWTGNIASALAALDPARAATYQANAAAYDDKLSELDRYVQEQVARIPAGRRKLVTDHEALEYFAARYGFDIIGTVIPGYSTIAEPSAANMAELINKIRREKVPAVFIGTTANPKVAQTVARETAAQVLPLYSESLGGPGSGADTYLGLMRTDVDTIVKGLGG